MSTKPSRPPLSPVEAPAAPAAQADPSIALLGSVAGLARSLTGAGRRGRPLADELAGLVLPLADRRASVPFDVLARIETRNRRLHGICLSDTLTIRADGKPATIPIAQVRSIFKRRFALTRWRHVELFDGSRYAFKPRFFGRPQLRFLTTFGVEDVPLTGQLLRIEGCGVSDVQTLRSQVEGFLERRAEALAKLLGQRAFGDLIGPDRVIL